MKLGWITAALGIGFAALLGGQFYTLHRVESLQDQLAAVRNEQALARESIDTQIARLEEAGAAAELERKETLDSVRVDLQAARRQAAGAAGRVQQEALKTVASLEARLSVSDQKLQETHAKLASELTSIQRANSEAESSINTVSTEVDEVKSEVALTRSELQQTAAELQRTRGDLGELSGLIATNSEQIAALRALGDRDYLEFTLFKAKDPVQIGDVSMLLKKTDTKNGRYSVELYVNDLKVEKKDRTINEPLQFFVRDRKQPHELVVNRVGQDSIAGYVASPKEPAAR